MRQLSLHASALNDVEYDLYTSSLSGLAWTDNVDQTSTHDDAYYDKMKLGVREARGWLRGRYSQVAPADIDVILRFFSPDLSQADTLSGGQFFAALRLVVHVENGKEVDRGLAFVQAQPKPKLDASSPTRQPQPDLPPPTPMRRTHAEDTNPFPLTNPVSPPPFHPLSRQDVPKSQPIIHTTHNPFVNRSTKPLSNDHPTKGPPLPPRKQVPTIAAHSILLPPPRHNSILLPPSGRKSVSPTRAMTPGSATLVPPPVVPPSGLPFQSSSGKASHVTSNLMKQSLQASKAGQTMKKAEEQLEQERVMQVLKSSSVISGTNIRNRSSSPTKVVYTPSTGNTSSSSRSDERAPPLPRRITQQQQPSPPVSISSLEEVAFAATNSRQGSQYQSLAPPSTGGFHGPRPIPSTHFYTPSIGSRGLPDIPQNPGHISSTSPFYSSPASSPSRPSVDLPQSSCQPPTHPNRKPSYFPYQAPTNFSSSSNTSRTSDTHVDDQNAASGPFFGSNYSSTPAAYGSSNVTQQHSPFRNPNPSTPEGSPSTRIFRSKSMHHPSPPLPPIPPPIRRKRPESVQVLGSGEIIFGDAPPQNGGDSASPFSANDGRRPGSTISRHTSLSSPGAGAHRRSSLSMSSTASARSQPQPGQDAHALPMSNIQRTIATLQPKLDGLQLQPRLDKARYKAEAGISRRGFVRERPRSGSKGSSIGRGGLEGEEKEDLLGSSGGSSNETGRRGRVYGYDLPGADRAKPGQELDDGEMDSDETGDGAGDGEGEREWRRATRERWAGKEMDELKWPAGDGWKPL